jgi:hypothetical protein
LLEDGIDPDSIFLQTRGGRRKRQTE